MRADSKDVLREEYSQLWTYYRKTLDERKNLFDWYFKTVTLPASVLGLVAAALARTPKFEVPPFLLPAFLGVVFLTGFILLITYKKESANASAYDKAITLIRRRRWAEHPELFDVLTVDRIRGETSHPIVPGGVPAWRGMALVSINSGIGTLGVWSLPHSFWWELVLVFVFFLLAQEMMMPPSIFRRDREDVGLLSAYQSPSRDRAIKLGYDLGWALKKAKERVVIVNLTAGEIHKKLRQYVDEALQRGINIDIYFLDPENPVVQMREEEMRRLDGTSTSNNVRASVNAFRTLCEDLSDGTSGVLTIWTYLQVPYFEVLAVDADITADNACLLITLMLNGTHTNDAPTLLLDRSALLFKPYLAAMNTIIQREDNKLVGHTRRKT